VALTFRNNGSFCSGLLSKYADVKVAATDANVYDVANGTNGLAKLQSRVFAGVNRTNTVEIADI